MSGPLVSAAELAAELGSARAPVVLDVRWSLTGPPGRASYDAGHVPGAVFCDLDTVLADPPGPRGRHPLPDPARVQGWMRAAGVRGDRGVVVYDARDATAAARAWWVLRWLGHGDVRVLDGGFASWEAAGLAVSVEEPAPAVPGDFVARPGAMPVLDTEAAARLAGEGLLLDARAAERYRGEVEPVDPVAGHVPGAVSAPTTGNVAPDGRLLPREALRSRFAALGVRDGSPVGVYCGSGVTAAHEVLALELAGVAAALWPGSWSEWVADPSRPVAVGGAPV